MVIWGRIIQKNISMQIQSKKSQYIFSNIRHIHIERNCNNKSKQTYQYMIGNFIIHNTYAEYVYDSFLEIVWVIIIVSLVIRADLSAIGKYIEFISPLTMGVFIIHPLINSICIHFITVDSILISIVYFVLITVLSFAATYILSKLPLNKYFLKI